MSRPNPGNRLETLRAGPLDGSGMRGLLTQIALLRKVMTPRNDAATCADWSGAYEWRPDRGLTARLEAGRASAPEVSRAHDHRRPLAGGCHRDWGGRHRSRGRTPVQTA